MFSNNIKSFIMMNIYFLIIVDIILLLAIYFVIIKDKVKTKKYEKSLKNLRPKVLAYIENEYKLSKLNKALEKDFDKNVAIDIMLEYSEKNDMNINEKFIYLHLDAFIIKKIKRKGSIDYIKKLAFMKVETGYDILLENASAKELEISYMSFFGLAMINMSIEKKEIAIKKLITSDIFSDRIIELLNKFELSFEQWLELLEKEESVEGKVVFIKSINQKEEIEIEENSDRLLRFINDEKEIKIAAILALCSSKNKKYIDKLVNIYENEENWEVRVSITKGLSKFDFHDVKDILLKMTKDNEWWVRFNAVKSIVAMGEEGLFMLVDLSLESGDKNISDLAYYFLNSNKDVYDTVNDMAKNVEV